MKVCVSQQEPALPTGIRGWEGVGRFPRSPAAFFCAQGNWTNSETGWGDPYEHMNDLNPERINHTYG